MNRDNAHIPRLDASSRALLDALDSTESKRFLQALLRPRMIEERMLRLLRQGKISKWFSGIGQEAVAVGATLALNDRDWILPLHRNLGVFTTRDFPLDRLFAQWQGKATGYTRGRDRSFHFGHREKHVVGMISHLGSMLGVADGIALASTLIGDDAIAVAFIGDGGTSEGDFHEALNLAAVWDLPVIFLVEQNGYALSTPVREQYRCASIADKAAGYGIEGRSVDGNDLLAVHATVLEAASSVRRDSQPILIEAVTFRLRGHEEASGTAYVPQNVMKEWESKDPVVRFQRELENRGMISEIELERICSGIEKEIDRAIEHAFGAPEPTLDTIQEVRDVFAPIPSSTNTFDASKTRELRLIDAVSEGIDQGMERNPRLVIMGQDIAEYGGVFKVTAGLLDKYGPERIRNTPLCEAAVLGAALGLSIRDIPSIVEMQFADFVSEGFNQIVNNLAKTYYRWGTPVNVTVRLPTGGGVGAGPFHSQSNEAWFTHVPGLKVAFPSNPFDAKGLLLQALNDPNPVLFFEHKALYRRSKGPVPTDPYVIEFGHANVVRSGNDATVVTYGSGVGWAIQAAHDLGVDLDVIDLRTLIPLDLRTVADSVRKTGRCLVLHEATQTGGFGGEIVARITESAFEFLDAPVLRCGSLDTPVPFQANLESGFLANSRLTESLHRLLRY